MAARKDKPLVVNGDEVLWQSLTPMELAVARIMRAHVIRPAGSNADGEYVWTCSQCHTRIETHSSASVTNVERFHHAQVIIRALAGE